MLAMVAGMEVITVFCSMPATTCAATGSELSWRIWNVGRCVLGPKAMGLAPKPAGIIRAVGAPPLRTSASAVAAV